MRVQVTPKLYVLAGNHREFEIWRSESMMSLNDCVYVHSPEQIRGLTLHPFQVIHYGSWYVNAQSRDIEEYLKLCYMVGKGQMDESRQVREGTGTPARATGKRPAKPAKPEQR